MLPLFTDTGEQRLSFSTALTQNWSFWRCPSQPISWLSTDGTKPNATKTNNAGTTKWPKTLKNKHKSKENLN